MKKRFLLLALLAAVCSMSANDTFWLGADISGTSALEAHGVQLYNAQGEPRENTVLMREYGLNAARFRVWVNPTGGFSSKEDVLKLALRAKEQGMAIMIDFHYSDWWADPGKQNIPKAWEQMGYEEMCQALAQHTRETLQLLKDNGIDVKWVQVGNETCHGFLWPIGRAEENMQQYAGLTQAGYDAVKEVYPKAVCIVHLDGGCDPARYHFIFDGLKKYDTKWDMIGLSVYPYWDIDAGLTKDEDETLSKAIDNINALYATYQSPLMIVETGYDADRPEDGKRWMKRLIEAARTQTNGHCEGVFYWAPEAEGHYRLGAFRNHRPTVIMDAFKEAATETSEFVNLTDAVPDAILEIRYFGTYNFVGTRVDGYEEPTALLTKKAAEALRAVSDDVIAQGYRLKIFDAYRPQKGVDHFVRWSKDIPDTKMKAYFYPDLDKSVLFDQEYIMEKSGHTRGSTVDLTLFDMKTEKEVDMGGTFDWFGPESHPDFCGNPETGEYTGDNHKSPVGRSITAEQFANRMILRHAMLRHGFKPLDSEWWHFTLKEEPFPDTYFTFPVKQIKRKDALDYVNTTSGLVSGTIQEGTMAFLGIPYAKVERFMPPLPVEKWEGVRACDHWGPQTMQQTWGKQLSEDEMSENCCVLNVWTTDLNAHKPVMLWLHGGGFDSGTSAWDPGMQLAKKDVVVVSVNHRLNILGFLDLSAVSDKYKYSGNVGMLDVVQALEWIRDNIANFGGDPNNVTIFGESGGGKVGTLMCMPAARGLFHKAIIMSGTILNVNNQQMTRELGKAVLKELNISPEEIDRIKEIPYQELYDAGLRAMAASIGTRKPGTPMMWGFGPTPDGEVLLQQPFQPNFSAINDDIPVLIGTTFNELQRLHYNRELTLEAAKKELEPTFGDETEAYVKAFAKAYPDYTPQDLLSIDWLFRPKTIITADAIAETRKAPTYMYMFTWRSPQNQGSIHGHELKFCFNTLHRAKNDLPNPTEADLKLADQMSSVWAQFAHQGNPNIEGLPSWQAYTPKNGELMEFNYRCLIRHNSDRKLEQIIDRHCFKQLDEFRRTHP